MHTPEHNLELTSVTKRYGLGSPVISDFNHTFKAGTSTGLMGQNGSGKTTLLRMLSVTSFPTSGQIAFAGNSVHSTPYAYLRHVGIVHDESSLPQFMSAVELLEYALRSRDKWTEDSPAHIDTLLDKLMLDERRQNLIGTYSSGMLKKTQIGMALIAEPSVLLMDEPFRGLDVDSLQAATTLFNALKEKGGLMVIASHRKDMLSALCDDYIHLEPHSTPEAASTK
ncbi:MAG: ATP-binding cassette domain-containing protein [Rhodothermales bacterium]